MAPKRRTDKLPPYVTKRKHGYELRVYMGKGLPMPAVKICPADSSISEVWQRYELFKNEKVISLSWLLSKYEKSDQFKSHAAATIKMQSGQIERICEYKTKSGKRFGGIELRNITPGVMRKYLDARKKEGSPVAGNREVAIISTSYNWALERDIITAINPCSVVKRNKENHRTRYVTEQEYWVAYSLATGLYLRPAMELAYLCRMRREEILISTRNQILDEGFDTLRAKGSKDAITLWSDRLTNVTNLKAGDVSSVYIIHDKNGQRITESAFKSAWTRLKKKMIKAGIEPFNFHDLKARGISNFEGDKLKASGHNDPKMLKVYDRKKIVVEATE